MRIFLSYASEQKLPAESIAFALRKRGHHVFLDKDDLPPGKSYDDQIQAAVFASDLMIFLISPESVTKGRYTLTELEYARHRWRLPHNVVLPVMLEATAMDSVPGFLKAVTIHEPHGNLAAEVAFWIEQIRGPGYVARVVGWFALAGVVGGLAYWKAGVGGLFITPAVPFAMRLLDYVGKAMLGPLHDLLSLIGLEEWFYQAFISLVMPAGALLALVLWRVSAVSLWRAFFAYPVLVLATFAGMVGGRWLYDQRIHQYDAVVSLASELRQSRQREDLLTKEIAELKRQLRPNAAAAGSPSGGLSVDPSPTPRQPNKSDPGESLSRASSLEWSYLRLQIGMYFGAVFATGIAMAGAIAARSMHSSRRWILTVVTGAVVAAVCYSTTDSLTVSFLMLHVVTFAILGYWIARGQE